MRRFIILLALLVGIALVQSVQAPTASAHRHWGAGGWGHHGGWGHRPIGGWGHRYYGGWGGYGHRNWGFGRGYVYRPYGGWYGGYRPYYRGWGYGGYGGYGYNAYYPAINYGYYPSYGSTIYYDNCAPVYQTNSAPIYYETQYNNPNTLLNYYSGAQNGGVSNQLTAGTVIAQLADSIRNQRTAAGNNGGRVLDGNGQLFNGRLASGGGIGNGRLRGAVQNIVGGVVQNQPVNANTINVRYSNPDARSKARAYMTQGDNLFRDQRYAAAAQQYRAAASLAPDLAEANWRYSHTLVAMGEFDLAVNAVNRALAASSDTSRNGFVLDTLYGNIGTAKASHLERLANQALETDSSNAYFLLGMTLHYSGEAARAEKFFTKAAEVTSGNATHIAAFVPALKKNTPAAPTAPALLARLPLRNT